MKVSNTLFIFGLIPYLHYVRVLAQELIPKNETDNSIITKKYLPEVVKDDLIQILHVYNVVIKKEAYDPRKDYIEICVKSLEHLSEIGSILVSNNSGFERPNNTLIIDDIFNITDDINVIQKEMSQDKTNMAMKYGKMLNSTYLEKNLTRVISHCESFGKNVTQFGWQNKTQNIALFLSYCIVLESRILGLLYTFSIFIKIHNKPLWRPTYQYETIEQNLTKHWASLTDVVDNELENFNNTELNEIDVQNGLISLQGIGEGVLLNAVQLNENKVPNINKQCSCPTTGVHSINHNNTPSNLATFAKYSTCSGDVYGCTKAGNEYKICFPQEHNKGLFERYKVIQVGPDDQKLLYGGKKMPKEQQCFPTEHVEAKDDCMFCLCKCFEKSILDHLGKSRIYNTFSLNEVVSDVSKNKIVLSVQFSLNDGIINLHIQESTIKKFGLVDTTSTNVVDTLQGEKFYMNATHHTMALTDIKAYPNEVITGVRFVSYPHLTLKIRVHKYNFFTGQLDQDSAEWRSSNDVSQTELDMTDLEPLDDDDEKEFTDLRGNVLIQFEPTAWKKDLASHIVPYFDNESNDKQKVPLMGLGMIYRNRTEKEAGIISTRIHKYRFSKLWISQEASVKEEKINEVTKAGTPLEIYVPLAGILVVAIGGFLFVAARKRKRQAKVESPMNAPKIIDTVSYHGNDKSSSEDTSSDEESSDDESDDSSSDDSDSSVDADLMNKK